MRGPAGTRRGGVSMAGGRQGQGAGKGHGVRGHRLPSPQCFFSEVTTVNYVFRLSVSNREVASEYLFCVLYIHEFLYISHLFRLIYFLVEHIFNTQFLLNFIIGRHTWILLMSPSEERVAIRGKSD